MDPATRSLVCHYPTRSLMANGVVILPLWRQCRGEVEMAETSKGKKFERIRGYARKVDGKTQQVRTHDRSTPRTSKGPAGK